MTIKDFLLEIDGAVETVLNPSFDIEIVDTKTVPHFGDPDLTYDNLSGQIKKCKRLESCVLYVDIRNSAAISSKDNPEELARLYSAFVRSMVKAGRFYGGHVRNIIGDRVMVVFDQQDCFKNAVNTAILMNTVSHYCIDKRYKGDFRCGIGIDYGQMLVTKTGEVRRGDQTEFYRSFVWLGQPANRASRLTDVAGKLRSQVREVIHVGTQPRDYEEWVWYTQGPTEFLKDLDIDYSGKMVHKNPNFKSIWLESEKLPFPFDPILMTSTVLEGLKQQEPDSQSLSKDLWSKAALNLKDVPVTVYGGDIIFAVGEQL